MFSGILVFSLKPARTGQARSALFQRTGFIGNVFFRRGDKSAAFASSWEFCDACVDTVPNCPERYLQRTYLELSPQIRGLLFDPDQCHYSATTIMADTVNQAGRWPQAEEGRFGYDTCRSIQTGRHLGRYPLCQGCCRLVSKVNVP
jgi:hypothetical protein